MKATFDEKKFLRGFVEQSRNPGLQKRRMEAHCLSWDAVEECWEKEDSVPSVVFRFVENGKKFIESFGRVLQTEKWLPAAAGVREEFPPSQKLAPVFDGEEINLTFERDPEVDGLLIGLEGASGKTRSNMTLVVCYIDGEERSFSGKEIASGGFWELPSSDKKVVSVHLLFDHED